MKDLLARSTRKIFTSLILSAGMLAIANVESMWYEVEPATYTAQVRRLAKDQAKHRLQATPEEAKRPDAAILQDLRASLTRDEIQEGNPFSLLSSLDPMNSVLSREVKDFRRQTFRSPQYTDEVGYDLVHYEIDHVGGGKSTLMAYVDYPVFGAEEEAPAVVVMIIQPSDKGLKLSRYRSDYLIEERLLAPTETQTLVAQRLSAGVPFLSVAR